MNERAYDEAEAQALARQLANVESAPLADRQAARQAYHEAMRDDPDVVAERVEWLLNGSYGYGACVRAKAIKGAGRQANRVAQIGQLIAALEWQCPTGFACQAWNRLQASERERINAAVARAIEETECAI
jgi:hypothetical protein